VGTRLLTVEDDERIRAAVKLALEDEGWTVMESGNGEDAVEQFHRQPADVVLIDLMLPGMDGFELCRSIRRQSDVPIIMVTARNDTHDVVAGLEAGADDLHDQALRPEGAVGPHLRPPAAGPSRRSRHARLSVRRPPS
jgi:DNA-binding response OmpR family regulator